MNNKRRQNIIVYIILACVTIVVLIIAIASGGGGGGINAPTIQYQPIIPPTTKVLSPATTQNLTISQDGVVYTFFQSTAELQTVQVGDIIVSDAIPQAQDGFLRQVTNVTTSSGQVVVQTAPAMLSQAIQQGTVHIEQRLTSADIRASSQLEGVSYKMASPGKLLDEFNVQVNDVVIYDKDGDHNTQTDQVRLNGEIIFVPDLTFDLAIKDFKLQEALFQIDLEKTTRLEVEAGIGVDLFHEKIEIQRYYLNPITVFVGYVPVVITPIVTINVGADGEISFGARSSLDWVETYRAGLKYDRGSWQLISEHTGPNDPVPGPIEFYAAGSLKGFIGPQLSLLVYGMAGPYAIAKPNLELDVDPYPKWGVYLGVSVNVGFRFEFWGREIADYETEVISFRVLLFDDGSSQITPTPTTTSIPPPGITTITPVSPIPVGGNTSTVLIFDTSGSMDEPDASGVNKLQAARQSGDRILDILEAERQAGSAISQISLVAFSTWARIDLGLTSDISAARAALQNLYADDRTGMPDGLQTGIDLLANDPLGAKPVIILLSDGLPNVGLGGDEYVDENEVKQQVLDLAAQAGNRGICVYTVGFGDPSSGTIDEDFLSAVAQASGCGTYYNAQTATQLANVYVGLRHTSTGNVLLNQNGNIAQGEQLLVGAINIPSGQEQMLYTLNWPGSQLEAILIDPQGRQVISGYQGASFSTTSSLASVIVQNPLSGQWQVLAKGVDVPEGITTYNAVLSVRSSTTSSVSTMPASPGFPIALLILVLAGGAVAVYVLYTTTRRNRTQTASGSVVYPPGTGQLVIIKGPNVGQPVPMRDGLTIGRNRYAGLCLMDASVSRQHAVIRYSQGNWFIQDQGSNGGTYVNGQRVTAARLNPGDRIDIGGTTFEFR